MTGSVEAGLEKVAGEADAAGGDQAVAAPASGQPAEPAAAAEAATAEASGGFDGLDVVMSIPVEIEIVLGTTQMPLSRLMKLTRGAIIPLDRKVGEPVDIVVNNRIVARGEVVILDESQSRFGVSLTSVVGISADDLEG
ncbi:MAG: flagellar motor switch protein FliN [Filomicrobium sp.]